MDLAPEVPAGPPAPAGVEPGLARSASLLGLGNTASSVLGLIRDTIISHLFGSSGALSAYNLAYRVPSLLYDLLVGGMLSAALVPVFSDYTRPERRSELAGLASAVLSLFAIVLGTVMVLVEAFARPLAGLLGNFSDPALQDVLTNSLRLIAPVILLMGLSGGVVGLLYALKRFSYTAIAATAVNLGTVVVAPLLVHRLGISVLPLGLIAGSAGQLLVMLPALRGVRIRPTVAWNHPGLHTMGRLYVPIALGLLINEFQVVVDGRWASATGPHSVAWMGYASKLIQFPLGLVPVAVSLAALPSLSQRGAAADWDSFRHIFPRGLRLVLVLMIPATIGLWALAEPVIRLLFEHGEFQPQDTLMTAQALRLYLVGLMFAGVDYLLNYTFYARKDSRTPAVVGVVAVGAYFVTAFCLKPRFGFLGLVFADSVKQATHACTMTVLLVRSVGRPRGERILQTAARSAFVALAMGLGVWWLAREMTTMLPVGLVSRLLVVTITAGLGAVFYAGVLYRLGVPEVGSLVNRLAWRTQAKPQSPEV